MVTRRISVMAVVAAVAAIGILAGPLAAPASASTSAWQPGVDNATVEASVGAGGQTAAVVNGCSIHDWYYRIYVVGTNQTLFLWRFEVASCISDTNKYWTMFEPDDEVMTRNPVIQGSTVAHQTVAPNRIFGPISVLYLNATFQYCPSTCVKTFQPRLGWIYGLDGSRTYVGDVPRA